MHLFTEHAKKSIAWNIMSGQSEFWPDKWAKWPEIGQWAGAISSSAVLPERGMRKLVTSTEGNYTVPEICLYNYTLIHRDNLFVFTEPTHQCFKEVILC